MYLVAYIVYIVEYVLSIIFPLSPENMHSQLGNVEANFSHTQNDSCNYSRISVGPELVLLKKLCCL